MAPSKKAVSCPAEITLKIIGGRWRLMILHELYSGVTRFGDLHRSLKGISQKILVQQLRELEKERVINRKVYPQVPPKVEYSLTDKGKALRPIIDAMEQWGVKHLK
jgi:DNA-binding HxlR family transcriptional regulator